MNIDIKSNKYNIGIQLPKWLLETRVSLGELSTTIDPRIFLIF